jgi:uncharacterized membrane protein YgcG
MSRAARWVLVPALVAGWLTAAGPARAITPQVKDDASFFSPAAVKKADEVIREIKQRFNKDLVVETFKTVPANKVDQVKEMDQQARNRFFADWVAARARELDIDGVYVLICKQPSHIQVGVGPETRKRDFTLANRDELARSLLSKFKAKEFDDGLLQGVQYVRDTIAANRKVEGRRQQAHAPPPAGGHEGGRGGGFNWAGLICPGLVILAVIWLVFGLIRAFSGMGARGGYGGGGYGPGGGYGGGGGGGFMSGLMGGLFGAMAGNWLYNSFLGGHSQGGGWGDSSAYGADQGAGPTYGSDEGRDFSSTGGDFGDGGDAGGGGGDFGGGGGDFGGGGGDWGGGGGDFGGGGGGFGGGGGDF